MYDEYINQLYSELTSFTNKLAIQFKVPVQDIEDYTQNSVLNLINYKPTINNYHHFKMIIIRCIKQQITHNNKRIVFKQYNLPDKDKLMENIPAKEELPITLPDEYKHLLTEDELKVAQMLSEGYTHSMIAKAFNRNRYTITAWVKKIRQKLEVKGYGNSQKQIQEEAHTRLGEGVGETT